MVNVTQFGSQLSGISFFAEEATPKCEKKISGFSEDQTMKIENMTEEEKRKIEAEEAYREEPRRKQSPIEVTSFTDRFNKFGFYLSVALGVIVIAIVMFSKARPSGGVLPQTRTTLMPPECNELKVPDAWSRDEEQEYFSKEYERLGCGR